MAHDVFISYSQKDKPTADAVCTALEVANIRCWIAPRDATPGLNWGGSIIRAISHSRIMVLVFSHHANNSEQVLREVERAVSKGVIIVPFRIEEVLPSENMEYYLSAPHWLDAMTPPLEAHLRVLCKTAKGILSTQPATQDEPVAPLAFDGATHDGVHGSVADASPQPKPQAAVPRSHTTDSRPIVPRMPSLSPPDQAVPSPQLVAIRLPTYAQGMAVTALVLSLLAVVASGVWIAISPGRPTTVFAFCFSMAAIPFVGAALARTWTVSSRLAAFFLGLCCAVCASGLSSISLVLVIRLTGEYLHLPREGDGIISLFLVSAAIPCIVVGLIRAFLMMPKPKSSERIHS
jgi:TIR domain